MFLKRILLKNVRCFGDLDLSFVEDDGSIRKWTLILGENGTGKSNLLQAVALLTAGSNALNDLLGEPSDWIRYGKSFCEMKATLVTIKNEERNIELRIEQGDDRSKVLCGSIVHIILCLFHLQEI